MIPSNNTLTTQLQQISIPTNTHKIIYDKNRVSDYTDRLEAMRQAVYLILNTERYKYPIYNWQYGVELLDLIGQQMTYVIPTLRQRITDALMQDDRILQVTDFEFEQNRNKLHCKCLVNTIYGDFTTEIEVEV